MGTQLAMQGAAMLCGGGREGGNQSGEGCNELRDGLPTSWGKDATSCARDFFFFKVQGLGFPTSWGRRMSCNELRSPIPHDDLLMYKPHNNAR